MVVELVGRADPQACKSGYADQDRTCARAADGDSRDHKLYMWRQLQCQHHTQAHMVGGRAPFNTMKADVANDGGYLGGYIYACAYGR